MISGAMYCRVPAKGQKGAKLGHRSLIHQLRAPGESDIPPAPRTFLFLTLELVDIPDLMQLIITQADTHFAVLKIRSIPG